MNSMAKKGLGKGLAALMSDEVVAPTHPAPAAAAEPAKGPVSTLPIAQLQAGKYQPRHRFDDEVLHELADSIERNGILQPLVVRPLDATHYEIIAGERRFRAAQLVKLTEVPVIIRDVSDIQALEMALVENIQRADLNPIEEAAGYQRLIEEFKYTQEKLASVVGKSRSHVANLLRLLDLPPTIKKLLVEGKLTMGHARALLTAANAEQLAQRVVAEGLNVRQTETLAQGGDLAAPAPMPAVEQLKKAMKGTRIKPGTAAAPSATQGDLMKTEEVQEIETMLAENLGLKVSINTRGAQSGEVVVSYGSLSELDEVLRRLGGTMY